MKSKAAKVVKWIIVAILLVILAVLLVINVWGNSIVKNAIEYGGTKALNVGVTVGEVDLSIVKAKFEVKDLTVNNPAGYKTENMLKLGNMVIDSSFGELMAEPAVIEEIMLDNVEITLEQKGMSNNIKEILNNISKEEPETQPEQDKEAKKLKIKRLEIKGVSVNAKILPIGGAEQVVKFKLDPIVMENIGTDEPVDVAMVSGKILTALVAGIIKQGGGLLPEDITGTMQNALGSATEVLDTGMETGKKILESGTDVGKNVGEGVKDVGEDVKKGLEGLFKKEEK